MRDTGSLVLLGLLLLGATAVRPVLFRMLTVDRAAAAASIGEVTDRGMPELRQFLEASGRVIQPSSRVAIVVPARSWDEYSYAYYRASYILAGREVLPVHDRDGRVLREHIREAEYVASWPGELRGERLVPVLRAHGGTLYRRAR